MLPFINMAMLAGLTAAAVPVIIHLLNKSRYRVVRWGAMIFLGSSTSKKRRSINLQQILLLIIRTLLIACFALALARPVVKAPSVILGGDRTALILLDSSYSMGARRGAGDRFEEAKAFALDVVESLERGDRAAVVLLGTGERPECPEPDADLDRVAAQIRDARLGHGRTDGAEALACAFEKLRDLDTTVGREVYLITDSQKASWPAPSLAALAGIGKELEEARLRPEVFLVEVEGEAQNAAVRSITIDAPVLQAGRLTPIAVTVANYGDDAKETSLKLMADGQFVGVKTVKLEAGLEETVRFTHVFDEPGSHLLMAVIRPDALAEDDAAALSVDVLDQMPVLLVNGDRRGELLRSECGFLRLALEPRRQMGAGVQAGEGRDLFRVEEVAVDDLPSVDYSLYRSVALANVAVLPETELVRIEDFVSKGGGLLLAPGDMVRASGYNTLFWRGGEGLSPAELAEPTGDDNLPEFPAPVQAGHPVFRFLAEGSAAPRIGVRRRFTVKLDQGLPADGDAEEEDEKARRRAAGVLMRTTGGEPLIIERGFGKGRVVLSTLPLDADWSDLPQTTFYVPFVWNAFGYIAGDAFPPRNVSVGEALATWLDGGGELSDTVMYAPPGRSAGPGGGPADGEPVRVDVKRRSGRDSVAYDDTREPGVYQLKLRRGQTEETVYFVVGVPRDESDLRPLPRSDRDLIEKRFGTEFLTGREELRRKIGEVRTGSELWRPLLLVAIALACLEIFVAARWHTVPSLARAVRESVGRSPAVAKGARL